MLTELGGKNQRGSEIRAVDPTDTLSREPAPAGGPDPCLTLRRPHSLASREQGTQINRTPRLHSGETRSSRGGGVL